MLRRALACALLALSAAPAAALASHSQLAGHWPLEVIEHDGQETPDLSGHGNTGQMYDVSPEPGRLGSAIRFNGALSRVSTLPFDGNEFSALEPERLTVSAWVKRAGAPGNLRYLVAKGASGCDAASYGLYTGGTLDVSDGLRFYVYDGLTAHASPVAGAQVWDGGWHAVAGTFDGSLVRLYVDGQQVGAGTAVPPGSSIAYGLGSGVDLTIGNWSKLDECGYDAHFPGAMDDVRIFNRALSPAEIATLHGLPGGGDGPAPRPLSAGFTAPATAPLQLAVLDARSSTGASRYRWDVNGDGRDDVECGGNSPLLGVRLARAGTRTVRLAAVAADARTAIAAQTLTIRGTRPPSSVIKSTPEVAICAGTESALTQTGRACADSAVFGIVEVRGCLTRVTRREDLPSPEARVVDEYYANLQIPAHVQVICNKGLPQCPDFLARHSAFELLVSKNPVKINGVSFYPRRGASIVVFPVLQRVVSSNAEVAFGSVTTRTGAIDLALKNQHRPLGKQATTRGRTDLFSFDARPDLPSIGGFKLDGEANLAFVWRDGRRFSEAKVRLALPPMFKVFGGSPPSGEVTLEADNNRGPVLDRLSLRVPEANLGALRFTNVGFDYSASGDETSNCSRAWWKATANVLLWDAGFFLSPPPSQNGIAFCNGSFRSAGGRLVFGAPIPPPQIFPGVFLDEISFAVALDPTLLRGGARISVAQIIDVDGQLLAVFPSPAAPYVLTAEDAGSHFAKLAGRRFVSTTIGAGGTVGLRVPVLGRLQFGSAYLLYSYPDYVSFGGGVRVPAPGLLLTAGVDGELSAGRGLFSVHGYGRACIAGGLGCLGADAWVTSKGVVICGSLGPLHPGAGYRWGDTWPTIWLVDGCKPSHYWPDDRGSAAQVGPLTFTVARGERTKNIRLAGAGSAPEVEVRGPDGEVVSTAPRDFEVANTLRVLRQEEGQVTWIGVENGKPGTYTVTPLPGSAAVARLSATRPQAAQRIRARVTGSATKLLSYDVVRRAGERVTFFERGAGSYRRLGSTSGGRGAIRFIPAAGPGGRRRIVAEVALDGVPSVTLTVARYRAPRPARARRPARLLVRRRGTTVVAKWGGESGAKAYGLVVKLRSGAQRVRYLSARRRQVRLRAVPRHESGRLMLRARGELGDWSRARTTHFRATAREPSRLRPFRQLGRRPRARSEAS